MENEEFLKKGIEVFDIKEPNTIAYMPIIIGKLFMEHPELYSRLHYKMPEENGGPLITMIASYVALMKKYLKEEEFIKALECYKYAVMNAIKFKCALKFFPSKMLNQNEKNTVDIKIEGEDLMVKETLKKFPNFTLNETAYKTFLEIRMKEGGIKKEILDIEYLKKKIEDYMPESTFGQGSF